MGESAKKRKNAAHWFCLALIAATSSQSKAKLCRDDLAAIERYWGLELEEPERTPRSRGKRKAPFIRAFLNRYDRMLERQTEFLNEIDAGLDRFSASEPSGGDSDSIPRIAARRHYSRTNDPEKIELDTPEGRLTLLGWIRTQDTAVMKARKLLLAEGELLRAERGGLGITFSIRERASGKTYRYKMPIIDRFLSIEEDRRYSQKRFKNEMELCIRAGKAKVAPNSQWLPDSALLRMDEIQGINLEKFANELRKMSEADREKSLERLTPAAAHQVDELHRIEIAHLDIKPANMMGSNGDVFLLDYGLALKKEDLERVGRERRRLSVRYDGSPFFQGQGSQAGTPGFADDLESLGITLAYLFSEEPQPTGAIEGTFVQKRPRLRAVLGLLSQPIAGHPSSAEESHAVLSLLSESVHLKMTRDKRAEFWNQVRAQLAKRSAGQQLKILFGPAKLNWAPEFMAGFSHAELADLIDRGMRENGWTFDKADSEATKADTKDPYLYQHYRRIREYVDLENLKYFRQSLSPVPSDLLRTLTSPMAR